MFRNKYILITIIALGLALIGVFIYCYIAFNRKVPKVEYGEIKPDSRLTIVLPYENDGVRDDDWDNEDDI